MRNKIKKFLAVDPAMKGKEVYVVYHYDTVEEALESEGPYYNKDRAYNIMNTHLEKGTCSWVVSIHA